MCDTPHPANTDIVERFYDLHEWSDRAKSELSLLKDHLGLRLSVDELVLCAGLYQRRDPSVREVRFVDALLDAGRHDPARRNIASFQTKDKTLADAFARVLAYQRGALSHTPPTTTLRDAWETLSDRAASNAFCYPHMTTLSHVVAAPLQGRLPTDAARIEGTPWYVTQTAPTMPYRPRCLKKGDLCSLIQLPPDADTQTVRPLISLLSERKQQRRMLRLCAVTRSDLIPTLLSLAEGWQVDLSAIEGLSDEAPHVAFDHLPSGLLVCANEKNTRRLCDEIRALGFAVSAFARVGADRQLTLTTHGMHEFSLESLHLRLLLTPQPGNLILPCGEVPVEMPATVSAAALGDRTLTVCTLPLTSPLRFEDIDALARRLYQAADVLPSEQPPLLSVGLTVSDRTPPATLWATALALLRFRDECGIALCSSAITFDPNAPESELTLCLITPKQDHPTDGKPQDCKTNEPAETKNV